MVFYCFFSECLCTVVRAAPCMLCLTLNCILQLLFYCLEVMCVCAMQARTQGWFGWFQRTPLAGLKVAVFCRETTGPPLGCCRLHLKASKEPPSFVLWVRALYASVLYCQSSTLLSSVWYACLFCHCKLYIAYC